MLNISIDGLTILALVSAGVATIAFVAALQMARIVRRERWRLSALESQFSELREDLTALRSGYERSGIELQHLVGNGTELANRLGVLEARPERRAFDAAIDSARRGAEPLKLREGYGLTRGEADLIARLHGRVQRA
jgi:hypothetical protein